MDDTAILIDMMLKYPSILPTNREYTEFQGYLPINGIDYKLKIQQQAGQKQPILTIMNQQLQKFQDDISSLNRSTKHPNIVSFLDKLKEIITAKTIPHEFKNVTDTYKLVISEYVELREFYINIHKCRILHDLSAITISHLDESNRQHQLEITVNLNNKSQRIFKVTQHSLPERKDGELFENTNSLKSIYEKFVNVVERLQNFFDNMDSLDHSCHILDPEKPSRKDCYRRISLDQTISIIITLDPWNETCIPSIKFLGPDRVVEDLRQKVANNLINWKSNANIVDELLKLLELSSFPMYQRDKDGREEMLLCDVGECCICFSLRLNDKLPEIVCQNASCEQFFHKECLYQWLVSVNAKQSFNELNGQCPNCEKHISCPL